MPLSNEKMPPSAQFIVARLSQSRNASLLTVLSVLGSDTSRREVQPQKRFMGRSATPSRMTAVSRLLQSRNIAIVASLPALPPTVTLLMPDFMNGPEP